MKTDDATSQRIAKLSFGLVYPLYLALIARKGRRKDELDQVITWLTGLDTAHLEGMIAQGASLADLFDAATLNPNAGLIKGVICGVRVQEIANPLTQKVRYLDKLVDDLAKGRAMEKVLR